MTPKETRWQGPKSHRKWVGRGLRGWETRWQVQESNPEALDSVCWLLIPHTLNPTVPFHAHTLSASLESSVQIEPMPIHHPLPIAHLLIRQLLAGPAYGKLCTFWHIIWHRVSNCAPETKMKSCPSLQMPELKRRYCFISSKYKKLAKKVLELVKNDKILVNNKHRCPKSSKHYRYSF